MPWSEKQNKLFRAAAHNSAFAKKVGIKQSDAARMAKEGIKKAEGGGIGSAMKQKINRLKTEHGMGLKMPMTPPKRKYAGGGRVDGCAVRGLTKARRK